MTKNTRPSSNFIKHTNKNPLQKFLIRNFYNSLVSLASSVSPNTVLDVGCGEGFTMEILKTNKIATFIEGIEYENDTISLAKKLFPNLNISKGSAYQLPYKNNSFDLVVCTEVLEHLENPTLALTESIRVSKKNIIISVPNEPLFMLSNFFRGKNILKLGNDPGHINHWSFASFKKFLIQNGVKIKKTKLPFPWIIVLGET